MGVGADGPVNVQAVPSVPYPLSPVQPDPKPGIPRRFNTGVVKLVAPDMDA